MQHFLGAAFKGDLNRTNPLGMSGELAEAFGHLMHNLWKGDVSVVAPRSFKAKVGGAVHSGATAATEAAQAQAQAAGGVAELVPAHLPDAVQAGWGMCCGPWSCVQPLH
jgi:hypothetical protein